jgi:crossover junction endodeoxyribonuclease RuvC
LKILGVDPGLNTTGYGIIKTNKQHLDFITAGTITTKTSQPFPERLEILYTNMSDIIEEHSPDIFAIEETFVNINARSSLMLGHARGVLILSAQILELPIYEYATRLIKKSITGNGAASKKQVKYMVEHLLNTKSIPKSLDISDALATAITFFNQHKFKQLMNQ